jgi:hypothetical protein
MLRRVEAWLGPAVYPQVQEAARERLGALGKHARERARGKPKQLQAGDVRVASGGDGAVAQALQDMRDGAGCVGPHGLAFAAQRGGGGGGRGRRRGDAEAEDLE